MSNFHMLKTAIEKQFNRMSKHPLFYTAVEKNNLWETYLKSFPEGSNPIYRERTVHDCSCCRQFIKTVGSMVAIIDDEIVSLWDASINDPNYEVVASNMRKLVKDAPIKNQFMYWDRHIGTDKSYEHVKDERESVVTWEHFHGEITMHNQGRPVIRPKKDIPTAQGGMQALHDVLLRSCKELTTGSINTVLELIAQNSLYRGEEHKSTISKFKAVKKAFDARSSQREKDIFIWQQIDNLPGSVSKIRNTSIGTLLTELSEGMDIEEAVRRFEAMVAPANYKRPTALVTKTMVFKAKETIDGLGLTSALERRYARLTDISINNVIFANRSAKKSMKNDPFDLIPVKSNNQTFGKNEKVSIDQFIKDVVPNVESIELFLENAHTNNLVSLIAPQHSDAAKLLKWDNNFSWSYNGDFADSIKEKVKKAGGNVSGDFCCRLAWFNYDDLDFHMRELNNGYEICFCNKHHASPSGGRLDVDMNASGCSTREPVENIFYYKRNTMREGKYILAVYQFRQRESNNSGFEVEIDWLGNVSHFEYAKPVRQGEMIVIAEMNYTKEKGIQIIKSLPVSSATKNIWGLTTQEFHSVNVLCYSPNYWDAQNGIGNRHYFFMLDNCNREGEARGFYNEFLRSDLDKYRKVIELLGSKMKTEEAKDQLSGVGFSSTLRKDITLRVKGNFTRTLTVQI